MFTNHIYLIYINKLDFALNNLQWLICHKTKPNYTYLIYKNKLDLTLNNLQWLICHKINPNPNHKKISAFHLAFAFFCNGTNFKIE